MSDRIEDMTLNGIVLRWPEAVETLHRFGLDTCCGGALPLRTAADRHGLDLDEVVEAVEECRVRATV